MSPRIHLVKSNGVTACGLTRWVFLREWQRTPEPSLVTCKTCHRVIVKGVPL